MSSGSLLVKKGQTELGRSVGSGQILNVELLWVAFASAPFSLYAISAFTDSVPRLRWPG